VVSVRIKKRVAEVDDEAIGSIPYTGIISFRPKTNKTVGRYIRIYLTSIQFQKQVTAMEGGSVLKHFGPSHIKKMHMLVPHIHLQMKYSDLATPNNISQFHKLQQSYILSTLRDTLLPKLISGELCVENMEVV